MTAPLRFIVKCYQCHDPILIKVWDYISMVYQRYILRLDMDFICMECSPD